MAGDPQAAQRRLVLRGDLILHDRLLVDGALLVGGEMIAEVDGAESVLACHPTAEVRHFPDCYLAPGYVDLHVHGGQGADFMDGTQEAFATVLRAHLRHGTTSIVPTTTAARHDQILAMLTTCEALVAHPLADGPRVLGAHLYGPYFRHEARGCHPGGSIRAPQRDEFEQYLSFSQALISATVAPEIEGAESFVRAVVERGLLATAGHSHATFVRMQEAVQWGVRHVDHLYCAMSDKTRLRQQQPFPMRGGVLEATLYFDELTTEVIADGKHLSPDLLLLALKLKGPDRLALVTDCNRALDMPEGTYLFGPSDGGEPFVHRDGVGVMQDGLALASSVRGMDHMVRTFWRQTGCPLWLAVRLASLTPARIALRDAQIGSLAVNKYADVLVLDRELNVRHVFVAGREVAPRATLP